MQERLQQQEAAAAAREAVLREHVVALQAQLREAASSRCGNAQRLSDAAGLRDSWISMPCGAGLAADMPYGLAEGCKLQ